MSAGASDRPPQHADGRWLFGLFSVLFALSLVLHQLWWDGLEVASPHFVVIVAAFWAVLRPTSVARFLVMVAAEVVAVWLDMPGVGSHTLLVGLCGAGVLAYAASTTLRDRRLPDAGALFARVAPFLRVSLLIVYAAAALAKLNTDFLDGAVSCAAAMSARVVWFDPSLLGGSWRIAPAIVGTVLVEATLPVLLAVSRTRNAGLVLGTSFHLVLALAGNVPFSAVALAFYVAFLPADAPARVRAAVPWVASRLRRPPVRVEAAALAALVGGWLLGSLFASAEPSAAAALIANGTRLVVVAVVLVAAAVALAVRRRRIGPALAAPGSLRLGHPAFAVGIGLLVVNSLSPYLGLKTESTFTMFSNLHTEPGLWNHAFIPEAVRVFPYQGRLVRVVDSNDPRLERRSSDGRRLVRFELERYLRLKPSVRATYTPTGPRSAGARGSESPAPGAPPRPAAVIRAAGSDPGALSATALLDKVAKFRDVPAPGQRGC